MVPESADSADHVGTDSWCFAAMPAVGGLKMTRLPGMSFSADSDLETVSQFGTDAFGGVSRLEKAEVDFIQLGNSGSRQTLSWNGCNTARPQRDTQLSVLECAET